MGDQGIAEPDPQLRVAGAAADRVLEQARGILGSSAPLERFGDHQPALRPGEPLEKSMARLGQRNRRARLDLLGRSARQIGPPLERIARGTDQERRSGRGQCRSAHAEQAQPAECGGAEQNEDEPRHQRFFRRLIRVAAIHPPSVRNSNGASHKAQVAGSAVGLKLTQLP